MPLSGGVHQLAVKMVPLMYEESAMSPLFNVPVDSFLSPDASSCRHAQATWVALGAAGVLVVATLVLSL